MPHPLLSLQVNGRCCGFCRQRLREAQKISPPTSPCPLCGGVGEVAVEHVTDHAVTEELVRRLILCARSTCSGPSYEPPVKTFTRLAEFWAQVRDIAALSSDTPPAEEIHHD